MEIRNLRYFLAVAREENMTRAAEILHVTQPTLSKALKSLEDELGKKLFIRHSFSIRLTEEGVLLRNRAETLKGMPLFCSEQAWNGDIKKWAGSSFSKMKLEGSFRLSYNGSVFAREGLGYLLTFRNLIDTSKESELVFRPLEPPLETTLYITWNRYQAFTPIAERFLKQLKESFFNAG